MIDLSKRRLRFWALMAGALVVLAFTGDRLALSRPDPHQLRFAHTFTTGSERAILTAAIAEFQRLHPGVRIEQSVLNSETYTTVGWRLQFRARRQPDIYFHWKGFKTDLCIARGWAMDMAPYLTPGFVEEFVPAAIEEAEGVYFLPQSVDISNLVWYNRDLFDQLGLSEPRTMEEWLALCAQLREASHLPLAQGNRDLWPMGNFGAELLGQSLGPDSSAQLFEPGVPVQPEAVRGLRSLEELARGGAFDLPGALERGGIATLGDIDAKVLFLSGKAAQHVVGSWFMADIVDARNRGELKFSVGVFPIPAAEGETDAMVTVSTGYLLNPATRNPEAAAAFLELLLSRKYQAQFSELGNLSLRRDAEQFTTEPMAKRMLEILAATPVFVPPPDTGYRPEQAALFYELCGKLVTGRLRMDALASEWTREKERLARK